MIIRTGTVQEAVELAKKMPDFSNPYNLNFPDTPPPKLDHVLIAEVDGVAVGFRAGCRHSADTFAVWLAGVLPAYRQQGIGGALYRCQKDWLKSQGYQFIRTHVRNSNRVMLKILVEKGYHVVDVVRYDDAQRNKIVFVKNLWDRNSPMVSSALVVGLLRTPAKDRQLQSKLRDLTISWLRFQYRGRIIEDSSVNAILDRASEAGHTYCLILNHGSIVRHRCALGFARTLEDWASSHEFLAAGEILQSNGSDSGILSHGLLVDLKRYVTLGRPAYADSGETPGGQSQWREAGSNFVAASLAAGTPVQHLPAEVSTKLIEITPTSEQQANRFKDTFGDRIATDQLDPNAFSADQHTFLKAIQRQIQNSRRGIFVWNFEDYDDVVKTCEEKSPLSTIYSVAAGLKTNWILETLGFDQQTRIVYFDYSEQALEFKRLVHTEWNGEDYPAFLRYLFKKIQPGEAFYQLWGDFSPENIGWDTVEQTWQQEVAKWGGADVIKQHWQHAKGMRVEYVLCNVMEDPTPLIERMDNRPRSVIWWSNVFFTFYSNWFFSIEERRAIYNRFIRSVSERSPDILIYGNDYNNIAVNAVRAGDYADVYFQTEDDYLEPRKTRG